jgi:hypothetical protein
LFGSQNGRGALHSPQLLVLLSVPEPSPPHAGSSGFAAQYFALRVWHPAATNSNNTVIRRLVMIAS